MPPAFSAPTPSPLPSLRDQGVPTAKTPIRSCLLLSLRHAEAPALLAPRQDPCLSCTTGASFVRAVLLKRPNFHAGTQLAGPHTVRRSVGAMARTRNTDKIQKRLKEEERQAKAAAEEKK
ncbi:hypothetical protein PF002_g4357, partial [Phytophthora fragariae]